MKKKVEQDIKSYSEQDKQKVIPTEIMPKITHEQH